MIAVCNTSPLILLDRVGRIWLLEKLFQKVVIPPAMTPELRPLLDSPKKQRLYLSDDLLRKALALLYRVSRPHTQRVPEVKETAIRPYLKNSGNSKPIGAGPGISPDRMLKSSVGRRICFRGRPAKIR